MPTPSSDELRRRANTALQEALALAIARYLHDHPDAPEAARAWLEGDEAALAELDSTSIMGTASEALDGLDVLTADVLVRGGDLAEELRVQLAHARLDLQSARSGSFETAVGSLRDFLVDAGATPQDFDIH
jgi:hypothetical protein